MRISLKQRTPGQIEFGVIYGGIGLLALLAGRFLPIMGLLPACIFKGLTGLPCPTCGSTRSVVHLSHGDVSASLFTNPLTASVFIAAALFFGYSVVTLLFPIPRLVLSLSEREKTWSRGIAAALVLTNWIYLIVTL